MRDPRFREAQTGGIRLPHVAPINDLVDDLRTEGRGWVPYVAPMYGGVDAEMLSVFRDPGPMTNDLSGRGSGFLCLENDDPAAELFATLLYEAGLSAQRMSPWNAYPWYINRKPNAAEIAAGIGPLRRLLALLPRLRVIMLHGGEARLLWRKFSAEPLKRQAPRTVARASLSAWSVARENSERCTTPLSSVQVRQGSARAIT